MCVSLLNTACTEKGKCSIQLFHRNAAGELCKVLTKFVLRTVYDICTLNVLPKGS